PRPPRRRSPARPCSGWGSAGGEACLDPGPRGGEGPQSAPPPSEFATPLGPVGELPRQRNLSQVHGLGRKKSEVALSPTARALWQWLSEARTGLAALPPS